MCLVLSRAWIIYSILKTAIKMDINIKFKTFLNSSTLASISTELRCRVTVFGYWFQRSFNQSSRLSVFISLHFPPLLLSWHSFLSHLVWQCFLLMLGCLSVNCFSCFQCLFFITKFILGLSLLRLSFASFLLIFSYLPCTFTPVKSVFWPPYLPQVQGREPLFPEVFSARQTLWGQNEGVWSYPNLSSLLFLSSAQSITSETHEQTHPVSPPLPVPQVTSPASPVQFIPLLQIHPYFSISFA